MEDRPIGRIVVDDECARALEIGWCWFARTRLCDHINGQLDEERVALRDDRELLRRRRVAVAVAVAPGVGVGAVPVQL